MFLAEIYWWRIVVSSVDIVLNYIIF